MTPCEKLGYKVGDRFEAVEGNPWVGRSIGDILVLIEDDGSDCAWFRNETTSENKTSCGIHRIRPLKTEAERRGAKFGVGGVVKATGERCVYLGESLVLPSHWEIDVEGKPERWHRIPEAIRLDHEPEYKEIPFSAATDEWRMEVGNLVYEDGERRVVEIHKFSNGSYAFTIEDSGAIIRGVHRLTVRVPV